MSKIDLTIHKEGLAHNIQKAKENNIIIPVSYTHLTLPTIA